MSRTSPLSKTALTLTGVDETVCATSPADALLLRRLGIETLPAHETMLVRLERLIVPGAALIERQAKRLVKSIQRVGILQPPCVMLMLAHSAGSDIHAPDAIFEVIAGRRRVLAARYAGLTAITCQVYEASSSSMASLLTLIENEQRSAAWVKEVEALRHLLDERVGMTLDDLAAFGFDRAGLAERLKIAQLPLPLVERVLAGAMNHETARKLARLTRAQQERLAQLAAAGEEITAASVKASLRAQIDTGLAPMQAQLAQAWNVTPSPVEISPPFPSHAPALPTQDECVAGNMPATSLARLVADLRRFEQCDDYRTVPQAVRTLTTALVQQAQVCLRAAQPSVEASITV